MTPTRVPNSLPLPPPSPEPRLMSNTSHGNAGPVWIDAGLVSAADMHALYTGMTASTTADDRLRILWMINQEAHLTVGATQNAEADVDLAACAAENVPVLRRSLGGGLVWMDSQQPCFFLIQPKRRLARGHRHLFALGLALTMATLRQLGLDAIEAHSQDIWVHGRKIMGTGAATLDEGCVFGASFLLSFPAQRFLACVHAPSEGYREWVWPALAEGVTDWQKELTQLPSNAAVRTALLQAIRQRFEAPPAVLELTATQREDCIQRGQEELDELEQAATQPAVPSGLRINRRNHVFETRSRCGRLRLHITGTRIARIWCEEPRINAVLQERVVGITPERLVLRSSLGHSLEAGLVDEISCRIDALYRGIRG